MRCATRSLCSVSMTCAWWPLLDTMSARCIGSGVRAIRGSLPADVLLEVRQDGVAGRLRLGARGASADAGGVLLPRGEARLAARLRLLARCLQRGLVRGVRVL